MGLFIWSLIFIIGVSLFLYQVALKLNILFKLPRNDGRNYGFSTWPKRFKNVIVYMFGQRKFWNDDEPSGLIHMIIFWGFIILFFQIITMFGRLWDNNFLKYFFENTTLGSFYSLFKDYFEALVLVMVIIALIRWLIKRPVRLFGILPTEKKLYYRSHSEAILILFFIAIIMLSGFFYDASCLAIFETKNNDEILFVAAFLPFSSLFQIFIPNESAALIINGVSIWVHNLTVLIFLNLLPCSKHFHIVTVFFNIFLGKLEPKGRLPKRNFEVENPLFGRSKINDFTWKQALDMYSCTECGRCSSECPAAATKKSLAPRQFLIDLRDCLYENSKAIVSKKELEPIIGGNKKVADEVVWSCVTCRACEEACPVNIEYVDKIVDIRQHLVQEASRFPDSLTKTFKAMEVQSNPWGLGSDEKSSWMNGLEIPLYTDKNEYLYFVGCAGALDSNGKKATVAFTNILKKAQISFGVLGKNELCCGETARRLGNEYLFQQMATNLIELFKTLNVKKIIVNCPHCYNTFKNEYSDFGVNFEVEHAVTFVKKLVNSGKINIKETIKKRITYHDSCNLGRYNDIYDEPRFLLKAICGMKPQEMSKNKKRAMCCGAGGGMMWMEEEADKRVNVLRTEQALLTGSEFVATSCPYCRIMFDSAINERELSQKINAIDIMELLDRVT